MNKQFKFITLIFLLLLTSAAVTFGQEKLGKIFIKAAASEVNGEEFPDAALEETVKDLRKRPGKFILAEKESEADFLLVVVERNAVAQSGNPAAKSILAKFYVRDGAKWKPATKLDSGVNNIFWSVAVGKLINSAEKWVKANVKQ